MTTPEVDLYLRLSMDRTGAGVAVERQYDECEELCKLRGWSVRHVFTDNDLSATKGLTRPGFEQLLVAQSPAIVVWHLDRLVRVSKELERVIDLGVNIHSVVSGHIDLSNPAGRAVARTVTAWATYEGEQKAERQRSAFRQRAQQGRQWWTSRPFGYELNGSLREREAEALRKVYDGLLVGVPLRQLAADLNLAGHQTCRGSKWTGPTLRPVLANPRNAAIRLYKGEEVGPGSWTPIVSEETLRAAQRLLTDPSRRSGGGGPRRYLLTGIASCGTCGGGVKGGLQRDTGEPVYVCKESTCVTHRMAFADTVVGEEVIDWLRVHGREVFAGDGAVELEELRARAVRQRQKLVELREDYDDDIITRAEFRESSQRVRERLVEAEEGLARAGSVKPLEGLLDALSIASEWDALSVDRKRGVVETLGCQVSLQRRGKGRRDMRVEDVRVTFS